MSGNVSASSIGALPMPIWPAKTYPLEPIQGWIHRAAERNYALSTDSFVDSLGLNGRDWDYDGLLNIVQQLPIEDLAELESCTPKRCEEGYEIRGHKLPYRFISKSSRRVCPMCLEEQRYVRTWFDIVPVASCPHHDVALIDSLPGDPLDWRHPEIGCTRSGMKVRAEHATAQMASTLDHFIVETVSEGRAPLPDHLDGMALDTILAASTCVGKLYRGDENHVATHGNLRSLCQLGFEPLLGGSDAILRFLREAHWLQRGYDKARYDARCDGVPHMLLSISDPPLRKLITDTFARVRIRNGLATPSGRLSRYDGEDDHLNIKSAAQRLGVTPHTMRSLLGKVTIDAERCDRPRRQRIHHDQLVAVQSYIADAFSSKAAANWLGCTPEDLKSLAARKLLRPDFRMGGKDHYTKSDLDGFVDKMISASAVAPPFDGQRISLFCDSSGISLAEAASRIMRQESLVVVKHDPNAALFHGLMVAPKPEAMRRACVRPNAQVRNAITHAEAAARLGTKHEGIKRLIEASFITTTKDLRGKDRICPASLDLFESRYVKASAYAPILRCSPTSALKILRKKGVLPINDWKGAGQRFVDRNEVMRLSGLTCVEVVASTEWQSFKVELDEGLAAQAVPATTRISPEPAIEVRATSGRWSLLIKRDHSPGQYSLTSNFTYRRQRGRLKKVEGTLIEPGEIWPGASVNHADGGGFVLVDDAIEADPLGMNANALIDRVITRAYQLHQIL